ncbi:MAG TPA: hypothetical protein VHX38_20765 [Pseudonocardiaceae bacterium]|jgi:hypothetical protein|nr:hypothetical protein [Pseudonocardiaceae bacterium]
MTSGVGTLAGGRRTLPAGVAPAVLMAAGLGWVGGTYHWPGDQWPAQVLVTVVHLVPVALVLLAVSLVSSGRPAGRLVLTVLAGTIKVMTVFAVCWAVTHPGGFGPHGFLDWVPIGMANAGGGLWLKTMIFDRRRAVPA